MHEAYMKLAGQRDAKWQIEPSFLALRRRQMRRILVDYARGQQRVPCGGKQQKVA
jgi:hypothetical protein